MSSYTLTTFVSDMKSITATTPEDIVKEVMPLARRLVAEADWSNPSFRDYDPDQGFGVSILNVEDDDTLLVEAVCWMPGGGVAPHDHQTWGVVVGIEGEEINGNWQRHDDGTRSEFADISIAEEVTVGPGDVCVFMPDDIHSVRNPGNKTSLSLHVYGHNLATRDRSEFEPLTKIRRPCPQRVRKTA